MSQLRVLRLRRALRSGQSFEVPILLAECRNGKCGRCQKCKPAASMPVALRDIPTAEGER